MEVWEVKLRIFRANVAFLKVLKTMSKQITSLYIVNGKFVTLIKHSNQQGVLT